MSIALREGLVGLSLKDTIDDLLVRFVINCPSEDLASIERLLFQIEEAEWFYLDFVRTINPELPVLKMKALTKLMIENCTAIWKWGDPAVAISKFGKYKAIIPVRGVALFNESLNKVLLVQGTESRSWSFPRGKINKEESDVECGVRECKEETSFDASSLIDENEYVERTIRGKNYKIFVIKGVDENFPFRPLVRNEISEIKWKSWKKVLKECKHGSNEYYLVNSMWQPLNAWVSRQKGTYDEEALKKYAEAQLKILLGIGESKKHAEDSKRQIDAGKEILGILKKENVDNTALYQRLMLPQGPLPIPLQQFSPFYGMPFMPPPIPMAPMKPPAANELLGLLHGGGKEKAEKEKAEKERIESEQVENERVEMERVEKERVEKEKREKERKEKEEAVISGNYLSLLKRKQPEIKSNNLLDVLKSGRNGSGSQGLLSVLNKSSSSEPPTSSSELLGVLNKPNSSGNEMYNVLKQPKSTENELLSVLNKQKSSGNEHLNVLNQQKSSGNELLNILNQQKPVNSGNELLGLLNIPKANSSSEGLLEMLHNPQKQTPSDELLGLLHKPRNQQATSNKELLQLLNKPKTESKGPEKEQNDIMKRLYGSNSFAATSSNANYNELSNSVLPTSKAILEPDPGDSPRFPLLKQPGAGKQSSPANELLSILGQKN